MAELGGCELRGDELWKGDYEGTCRMYCIGGQIIRDKLQWDKLWGTKFDKKVLMRMTGLITTY